jgi:hypothetical protein
LFPEVAAALVHFREAAAGSREQADDFRAPAVDSPVEAADFRAQADVPPGPAADFHASAADSRERVDDSRASAVDSRGQEADFLALGVDFLGRADAQMADSHASVADFLELVAASWPVEVLACSLGVHCFARAADSRAQAAGSLERVGEPGVELLVPAADFRARVAACGSAAELAGSTEAHSLVRAVDSREPVARLGSLELARWHALAVDCRVPLVSQTVQRSADLAALPEAFLLTVAVADWLAVLRLCSTAALERALHSRQCETHSAWVSSGPRELLEPTEPSSLRPVCLQAFPEAARKVSQKD